MPIHIVVNTLDADWLRIRDCIQLQMHLWILNENLRMTMSENWKICTPQTDGQQQDAAKILAEIKYHVNSEHRYCTAYKTSTNMTLK